MGKKSGYQDAGRYHLLVYPSFELLIIIERGFLSQIRLDGASVLSPPPSTEPRARGCWFVTLCSSKMRSWATGSTENYVPLFVASIFGGGRDSFFSVAADPFASLASPSPLGIGLLLARFPNPRSSSSSSSWTGCGVLL